MEYNDYNHVVNPKNSFKLSFKLLYNLFEKE